MIVPAPYDGEERPTLSAWAGALVPVLSDTTVSGTGHLPEQAGTGYVLAADHTSFFDPVLLAADHTSFFDPVLLVGTLHRLGPRPAGLATAGLWRVHRHVPRPHQGGVRAGAPGQPPRRRLPAARRRRPLRGPRRARPPPGGLPRWRASHDRPPGRLKSGVVRLALSTGVRVIPVGHAGARRVSSGGRGKQLAGRATAPVRRPRGHVHFGPAVRLDTSGSPLDAVGRAVPAGRH